MNYDYIYQLLLEKERSKTELSKLSEDEISLINTHITADCVILPNDNIKRAIEKKMGKSEKPAKKPVHKANRSARLVKKVSAKTAK